MRFSIEHKAKPVLKWAGGKSGSLPQLLENFPGDFCRYVEPFVGGGAVYFALNPSIPALINDSNAELIELYEVIRDTPGRLRAELDQLSKRYSEKFYYELRASVLKDKLARVARMVFLNKTGFNGLYRLNSKGGFNVPFGKRKKCPALYAEENLLAVSKRLQSAEITRDDFERIIDKTRAGDFVYCDPPYHPISATSSFNSYTAGGFSRKEQTRLKEACKRAADRGVVVAISNSSAKFILELYSEWDIKMISARRAINSKGTSRGEINETLVILGREAAKTSLISNRDIQAGLKDREDRYPTLSKDDDRYLSSLKGD